MAQRDIWIDWQHWHKLPATERARAFRRAAAADGHTWSEHWAVDVQVEIREARATKRQKHSKTSTHAAIAWALDAVVGPVVASARQVAHITARKRWADDSNPAGIAIRITTHEGT